MEIIEHGKTYLVYTCPRCRCVFVACEEVWGIARAVIL